MEEQKEKDDLVDISLLIKSMEGVMNGQQQAGPSLPIDEISCLTEYSLPLSDIYETKANDVLFAPTEYGLKKNHDGNRRFRRLINDYKKLYRSAKETEDKGLVVAEVVRIWRSLDPPGRFLVSSDPSESLTPYHDIGDEDVRRRATHLLKGKDDTNTKHRDDQTASTAGSSTVSRRESTRAASGRPQVRRNTAPPGPFLGGSFRGLVMGLFGKNSILNQYG